MLKTLRIRDLAIIEDITVEFGPGLNLLTGETGAGKSIVVDALGLAAGDRADSTRVRSGADARRWRRSSSSLDPRSRGLLEARGSDPAGEEISVRREVGAAGGGRVFLNGSPVAFGGAARDRRPARGAARPARAPELAASRAAPGSARPLRRSRRPASRGRRRVRSRRRVGRAGSPAKEPRCGAGHLAETLRGVIREINAVGPRPARRTRSARSGSS